MPSLLARFAASIFWMARYIERAESLARIIDINETYARDNPDGPDWGRVLDLYADTDRYMEAHGAIDTASVLNFYILDRANSTSIVSAVSSARNNARSVRHLISTEMWTQVNIFRNWLVDLTPRDIRSANVSRICTDIKLNCQTIEGIVEGTLLRDEAWQFYQIGKYLERADQTTRLLDIGYDRLSKEAEDTLVSVQWNSLLRSVAGYHAYRSRHPSGSYGRDVATFLLYDREFARAVALCVDRVTQSLGNLETRHGDLQLGSLEKARRALAFELETGLEKDVTKDRLHRFLDALQVKIGAVSDEVGRAYFAIS